MQATRYVLLSRLVEGVGLPIERRDVQLRHVALLDLDLIAMLALPNDDVRRDVGGRACTVSRAWLRA